MTQRPQGRCTSLHVKVAGLPHAHALVRWRLTLKEAQRIRISVHAT